MHMRTCTIVRPSLFDECRIMWRTCSRSNVDVAPTKAQKRMVGAEKRGGGERRRDVQLSRLTPRLTLSRHRRQWPISTSLPHTTHTHTRARMSQFCIYQSSSGAFSHDRDASSDDYWLQKQLVLIEVLYKMPQNYYTSGNILYCRIYTYIDSNCFILWY